MVWDPFSRGIENGYVGIPRKISLRARRAGRGDPAQG